MRKIKAQTFLFLLSALLIFAFGQSAAAQPNRGMVKGTIFIKNVSGNNMGNFACENLTITLADLKSPAEKRWKLTTTATGDFSTRKCSYKFARVLANNSFTAGISAQFPNGCDQKSFAANASFPMEVKSFQTLTYNFTVTKISCTIVK